MVKQATYRGGIVFLTSSETNRVIVARHEAETTRKGCRAETGFGELTFTTCHDVVVERKSRSKDWYEDDVSYH